MAQLPHLLRPLVRLVLAALLLAPAHLALAQGEGADEGQTEDGRRGFWKREPRIAPRPGLVPDWRFNYWFLAANLTFNHQDVQAGGALGALVWGKGRLNAAVGADVRLGTRSVLTTLVADSLYQQYQARRYTIWAGLEKRFNLREERLELLLDVQGGVQWQDYRGAANDPPAYPVLMPGVGLRWLFTPFAVQAGYRFQTSGSLSLVDHWATLGLVFVIPQTTYVKGSGS